jgi:tetratricopeptide (TPR) repeat protein
MSKAIGAPFKAVFYALVILPLLAASPRDARGRPDGESATVPAQHVNDVFDIANEEYMADNLEDAVSLYQGLLSGSGLKTADIYYNVGNAYFRLNEYGKAIASYRRALRVAPRDQDILANLRYVRGMVKDKIDQPKSTEMFQEMFFFHYEFNRAESEAIFMCAYLVAALLATLYLFVKPRALRWLAVAALALALTFGASTLVHAYHAAYPNEVVVVVDEADIRTGPGDNYIVSFNLHDGAELEVRKRGEDWSQIELPDGRRGWARNAQIEVIS